jgi:hypothetical protein
LCSRIWIQNDLITSKLQISDLLIKWWNDGMMKLWNDIIHNKEWRREQFNESHPQFNPTFLTSRNFEWWEFQDLHELYCFLLCWECKLHPVRFSENVSLSKQTEN